MAGRRLWCLAAALLVVYGVVLPSAAMNSASAHLTGWDLVEEGHLNYFNKIQGVEWASLIHLAEDEWQRIVGIDIK